MYGRYGTDTLNLVLLIAGLVIAFIAQLTRFWPLTLIAYAFYIYAIFRMLSRNTAQRQKEYYSFLKVWTPLQKWFRIRRTAFRERKTYKVFQVPELPPAAACAARARQDPCHLPALPQAVQSENLILKKRRSLNIMKVAIIGTWHVHTEEYTRAILENPKAEAVAVWDSDAARGKAFADKMGLPFTADLDSILNDADIDSIVLCSATCDHPALLQKAAAAKKNIFTEKVLTIGVEDAEKAAEAVKASGKVFTISYPHRTFPTLRAAKAMLDSGKLGRVTYARVRNVHNGSSADWLPPHFYDKAQCGGGAMIDLGAHPMYTLYWLLGAPKTITSTFTAVTNRGVEDNAVSVIEFENGAIGVSETGFVSECNPYTLEISGTDGSLMIHGESARWGGKATGGKWVNLELPEKVALPIDQWVDAVTEGAPAPSTVDEAVMLTRLMDGAYKSFESGTKFTF